jgi:4-alpha-glucanotransferase
MAPEIRPNAEFLSRARSALGVDALALIVFDASLPPGDIDIGVGSPYGGAARDFFRFARGEGFDAIQFGPQGWLSRANASPYDGASLSRNPLSLDWDLSKVWPELALGEDELRQIAGPTLARGRSEHARAHVSADELAERIHARFVALRSSGRIDASLTTAFREFTESNESWLVADALYVALSAAHANRDHDEWPSEASDRGLFANAVPTAVGSSCKLTLSEPARMRLAELRHRFAAEIERYSLVQFLWALQHQELSDWARGHGLELYGDLQAGTSRMDHWHFSSAFLPGYRLGAPPSRTNPEGQPWGYPVLRPELFEGRGNSVGPALGLLLDRAHRMFASYDRVRLDHPHALVCPWVYENAGDPLRAVQQGARLYSTPNDPRHPDLARYSFVAPSDLDESALPYADGRIRRLDPLQIARFARVVDALVELAGERGSSRLLCEVLSTEPTELRAVRLRHGMGCFRVTQKANVRDPDDRYRSENANEEDWLLMGNHDTPTIWGAIERWKRDGTHSDRCDYLAWRLAPHAAEREPLARHLREHAGDLATAQLADALSSRARQVLVSFGDLLGFVEPYNVPGVISTDNWSQRIYSDFRKEHAVMVERGRALSLSRALGMALRARGIRVE